MTTQLTRSDLPSWLRRRAALFVSLAVTGAALLGWQHTGWGWLAVAGSVGLCVTVAQICALDLFTDPPPAVVPAVARAAWRWLWDNMMFVTTPVLAASFWLGYRWYGWMWAPAAIAILALTMVGLVVVLFIGRRYPVERRRLGRLWADSMIAAWTDFSLVAVMTIAWVINPADSEPALLRWIVPGLLVALWLDVRDARRRYHTLTS